MGSDHPAQTILQAVFAFAKNLEPQHQVVVFAKEGLSLSMELPIELCSAPEAIEMSESPLYAVRRKRHSSLALAIEALHRGEIDALVSAGNTSAIVMQAALTLRVKKKPALIAVLPTAKEAAAVLDVGVAFERTVEEQLLLAQIGCQFADRILGRKKARLGLLNIGEEPFKGDEKLKKTYALLQAQFGPQFAGNIESHTFFAGEVDILLTNALLGNIFLKTAEAASQFIIDILAPPSPLPEKIRAENYALGYIAGFQKPLFKVHAHASISTITAALHLATLWSKPLCDLS